MRHHRRLHARAAHFGQGDGTRADGQTALERRLARRCLALAGHQAVAKQHLGDQLRLDARAFNRRLDGRAAQVVRGQRRKVALETAHGGAGGSDDHNGIGDGIISAVSHFFLH